MVKSNGSICLTIRTKSGPSPGVVGSSSTPRTPKIVPRLVFSVGFRRVLARNVPGVDETQHHLIKLAQNFDASPAETTGMRHAGPFFWVVLGSKRTVWDPLLGSFQTLGWSQKDSDPYL